MVGKCDDNNSAVYHRKSKYRYRYCLWLCLAVIVFLTISGCSSESVVTSTTSGRIHDNDGVYSIPANGYSVLYVNILAGTEGNDIPFYRLTGDDLIDGEKPVYHASVYDGQGSLADSDMPALGSIQIKGNGSYINYYRSFKISLNEEEEFKGQRVLLLYKCPEDSIKISMRLGMDLFSLFDDIVSIRTEFVRLYLRDESTGSDAYTDYGLYTLAENPGGKYLRAHGLDRNGELYEIKDFDFSYETYINASETQRKKMLEYKNGSNPEKFEEMLRAISNEENFEETFTKYFNVDNYLTWIGGCCLIGNYKAGTGDFLLYSPTDSDIWYFFPMPTDEIFLEESDTRWSTPPDSFSGAGWFTGNVIHYQFLKNEDNRNALLQKTKELMQTLDAETINKMLIAYKTVLSDFLLEGPDSSFLEFSVEETEARINRTYMHIQANYALLSENLKKPLPFNLIEPQRTGDYYTISWRDAISSSVVTYHLKITSDLEGENILYSVSTNQTWIEVHEILEGNFYVFLTAENAAGIQTMNSYEKGDSASIWGVKLCTFTGEVEP